MIDLSTRSFVPCTPLEHKSRNSSPPLLFLALFAVVSFLFIGCDLLNAPTKPDYFKRIDEEIAWANATRLTVSFHAPEGWISSSAPSLSMTAISRTVLDIRLGFEFSVECEPSSSVGFDGWLVFETEFYNSLTAADREKSAQELAEHSLIGSTVTLVEQSEAGGSRKAKFIIHTATPVTIVPWCKARTEVTMTNPPLINTGAPYSLGQTITIYFSEPGLAYETGELPSIFGEGLIQIKGQSIESSRIYPDMSEYYYTPMYNDALRTITIRAGDLPIEEMNITVTVGDKLMGKNGHPIAAATSFSWRTSTELVRDLYAAGSVWAVHQPDAATSEADFFYARALAGPANNYRDARLRKNAAGKYEVTLYFSIAANNDEMGDPTHCTVQEFRAYNLAGNNASAVGEAATYPLTPIASASSDGAANIYRSGNSNVRAYRITHELKTPNPQDGIWRLVLTPYRSEGSSIIGLDTWGNAYAAGSYASVALNTALPSRSATLTLDAEMSSLGTYSYRAANSSLSFDVNFAMVEDAWMSNGIPRANASDDKPWTIDNFSELSWQWRIVDTDAATGISGAEVLAPAAWNSTSIQRVSGASISSIPSSTAARRIQIRYRDTLNQTNADWTDTNARLTYYNSSYGDVSGWSAEYDPDSNTIAVNWTNPTENDFDHVEVWYRVNGMSEVTPPAFIPGSTGYTPKGTGFTIGSVPLLNTTGVQNGSPVSNIYRYEIFLRTCSEVDSNLDTSLTIWNFGTPGIAGSGMVVRPGNTAEANSQATFTAAIADTGKTNIVLSGDFTLSNWTTSATAFTRKLYGNGHTITISGFGSSVTDGNIGLFGTSGQDAIIRDVTITYDADGNPNTPHTEVPVSPTNAAQFGGIAGTASGNAQLINVQVLGAANITHTGNSLLSIGGMVGNMSNAAAIANAYSSLALTVDKQGTSTTADVNNAFVGGIVGDIASGGTSSRRAINGVSVAANVNHTQAAGSMYTGGAIGRTQANVTFHDIEFSGKLTAVKGAYAGENYIGGISGYAENGNYSECKVPGTIDIPDTYTGEEIVYLGGLWGYFNANTAVIASDCWARGDISILGTLGVTRVSLPTAYIPRLYAGGVTGYLTTGTGSIEMINCSYEEGSITITCTTGWPYDDIYTGGFSGRIGSNTSLPGCYTNARIVSVASDGRIIAGGFAASLDGATLSNCYSLSDVYTDGIPSGGMGKVTGGFAGIMKTSASTISASYATGNVTNISEGGNLPIENGYLSASGFIGSTLVGGNNINNCYALGTVSIRGESFSGYIVAGGIAGYLTGNDTISNCFSYGSVSSTRTAFANNDTYAGGIAGRIGSGVKITNCAALGARVSVADSYTASRMYRHVGHIWGDGTASEANGNYALDIMRLENGDNPNDTNPPVMTFDTIPPVMNGLPYLSGSPTSASIGGLIISDAGGSGLVSTVNSPYLSVMTGTNSPRTGETGAGTWDRTFNIITNIDLTLLNDNSNSDRSRRYTVTLDDNDGNSASYRMYVNIITPFPTNPSLVTLENFTLSGLEFVDSSVNNSKLQAHDNRYGQPVAKSAFENSSIWTRVRTASLAGMSYNSPNSWITGFTGSTPIYGALPLWDFTRISRGYPTLKGLGGQ